MKTWFSNENKENKSKAKPKKGMLGDELSKAEKLGKQLRYREEDFAEEKEAEAWIEETKKEVQPKSKELLKSSPFPAKRQSLKDKLRFDVEVAEEPVRGSLSEVGNKKVGIQLTSPFPPRKSMKEEEGQAAKEEPEKPQVQMSSPFPPRRNVSMEEKQSTIPEPKKVETVVQEVEPKNEESRKEDPIAWEPVAPWMQSVSTAPEVINRSEIHIEPSKKSLRTLAKDIIKNAPKETIVDLSEDYVSESKNTIEKAPKSEQEMIESVQEAPKPVQESMPYSEVYKTLDEVGETEVEPTIKNEFNNNEAYTIYDVETIQIEDPEEQEDDIEELEESYEEDYEESEEQPYSTELELDFTQMFATVGNLGNHLGSEVGYGLDDPYAVEEDYEEDQNEENSELSFPEDPLGLNTMFDISSIEAFNHEEYSGDMIGSEDAVVASYEEEVASSEMIDLDMSGLEIDGHEGNEMMPEVEDEVPKQPRYQLQASVSVHFSEGEMHILNENIGNVIVCLNSVGEKYDFTITKDEKGGQNLNITSTNHVISKVMALFE